MCGSNNSYKKRKQPKSYQKLGMDSLRLNYTDPYIISGYTDDQKTV